MKNNVYNASASGVSALVRRGASVVLDRSALAWRSSENLLDYRSDIPCNKQLINLSVSTSFIYSCHHQ